MPPEPAAGSYPFVSPDRPEGEAPHFVAEMFFLTQARIRRALGGMSCLWGGAHMLLDRRRNILGTARLVPMVSKGQRSAGGMQLTARMLRCPPLPHCSAWCTPAWCQPCTATRCVCLANPWLWPPCSCYLAWRSAWLPDTLGDVAASAGSPANASDGAQAGM